MRCRYTIRAAPPNVSYSTRTGPSSAGRLALPCDPPHCHQPSYHPVYAPSQRSVHSSTNRTQQQAESSSEAFRNAIQSKSRITFLPLDFAMFLTPRCLSHLCRRRAVGKSLGNRLPPVRGPYRPISELRVCEISHQAEDLLAFIQPRHAHREHVAEGLALIRMPIVQFDVSPAATRAVASFNDSTWMKSSLLVLINTDGKSTSSAIVLRSASSAPLSNSRVKNIGAIQSIIGTNLASPNSHFASKPHNARYEVRSVNGEINALPATERPDWPMPIFSANSEERSTAVIYKARVPPAESPVRNT